MSQSDGSCPHRPRVDAVVLCATAGTWLFGAEREELSSPAPASPVADVSAGAEPGSLTKLTEIPMPDVKEEGKKAA